MPDHSTPTAKSLFPRWSFKSAVILSMVFLTLITPSTTAWRRHRHKHGNRIPISNSLHTSYGASWRSVEDNTRHKRQQDGGYYPAYDSNESGPWYEWTQIKGCSRTCGGGVMEETRYCHVEGACQGSTKRFTSCNIEECPEGSMDFRAEQCARYNSMSFEGQFYSWVPYTKGPRRCELNCQPEGERFYYRHAQKVIDGTRCEAESRDVCVDGQCVVVGCDMIIGSGTKEDRCRACGGDGSTCTTITGSVDASTMTIGYNDIVLIPQGATNILIEELESTNNYLALRNSTGHYYLNGNWKIDFPNAMKFAGTTVYYERRAEGISIFAPEILRALGPTNESLYLVLLYQETNLGIKYEFSVPKDVKETENVIYEWRMNGWGECSVTCGGGHMTRNVSCVRASDYETVDENLQLCDPRLTPASNKTCNEQPCQSRFGNVILNHRVTRNVQIKSEKMTVPETEIKLSQESTDGDSNNYWQTGNWTPCSTDCGTPGVQYRYVYCGQFVSEGRLAITNDSSCEESEGTKPEETHECNVDSECPTYHVAQWSHCDKLCGTGKQTRKVTCHRVTNSTTDILEDSECPETKPETEKICEAPPCQGTDWITSEWTECKSPCGSSMMSRKALCVTSEGDIVPDILCGLHRKPNETQLCDKTSECSNRWYSSEWSECTESCGEGIQTRHVFCGSHDGEKMVAIVDDTECDQDKKLTTQEVCIGEKECENQWFTAPFGKCSKTCGGGQKKRLIFCFNNITKAIYTNCDKATKPFEKDQCNNHACSEDELMGITEAEADSDLPWCDEEEISQAVLASGDQDLVEDDEESGSGDSEESGSGDTEESGSGDTEESGSGDTEESGSGDTEESGSGGTEESGSGDSEESGSSDPENSGSGDFESSGSGDSEGSGANDTKGNATETTTENENENENDESEEKILERRKRDIISDDEDIEDGSGSGNETLTDGSGSGNETLTDGSGSGNETLTDGSGSGNETLTDGSGSRNETLNDGSGSGKEKMDIDSDTDDLTIEENVTKESSSTIDEEGSGFEEDGSGDEESGSGTITPELKEVTMTTDDELECRPRPSSCDELEYGCCSDGKTPADGPFKYGCEIFETCEETEHGCCPDDISPAQGLKFLGCPGLAICHGSLFGCCSDNFTEATGPDNEGCEDLIEFHCKETTFGCCPDESTKATGPNLAGCVIPTICEGSADCLPCNETEYGCCPDGETAAEGDDYEGCFDGSGGSGSGEDDGSTDEILPDCTRSTFGCCPDNYTAAHGENYEGCCLSSPFGCCPDHISIPKGPNFQGCGCVFSSFGCCPDNETAARGENNAGCGCEYTEFKCCPDNYTPSVGANQTGCPCNTFEFGCCPDGVSIAKGPYKQGCGCAYTEFGCCKDGQTPAGSIDGEDCGCEASEFGCCADGVTPAEGKLFEGCEEEAPIVPGEVCGFDKDRGPCRNFTVKFFFDIAYGGCTRFWYGGCEGNLNRFASEEECEVVCVKPEGLDACRLPAVPGPCSGNQPSWYHNSETESCMPFVYRGCLGNKNRFESKEDCEETCVLPEKTDVCFLDVRPGPCRGNFSRWYYDQTVDKCVPFTFGGCKGNANSFLSETECMQRCIRGRSQDICTLPKASGLCEETLPRWYYDYTETRCMPFYYTGCDGNANIFKGRGECEATCTQDEPVVNPCALPNDPGNCTDFEEKYFYDLVSGKCQTFLYGGCGGNSNNYPNMDECQVACENKGDSSPIQPFPTESCFLSYDQGTCADFHAEWYYDSTDGACKDFLYSGCGGNHNRFKSRQECENKCGDVQDICRLPYVVGPCNGSLKQYYYDYSRDECIPFDYSGCRGNKNRFDSLHLCQQRCLGTRVSTDTPEYYPEDTPHICLLPMYTGSCQSSIPSWYYDPSHRRCIGFMYTGCSGNANRFQSVELCERQCGRYRNADVCNENAADAGTCDGTMTKWYHDNIERTCRAFYYTGCEGSGNRFSTQPECEAECIYLDTILPLGNSSSETNIAICELEQDSGPCNEGYKRWFFNPESGSCELFIYGGCGGNLNRFKRFELCGQFCVEAYHKHRQPVSTERTTTYGNRYDPCLTNNLQCQSIQCAYGITRRVDSNNCDRCDCFEPCENMICPSGSECSVELIQSKTETYEEVRFEAVCREVSKPGTCPQLSGEITRCEQECYNDASCSGKQKCCFNGCAYACVRPVSDEPTDETVVVQPGKPLPTQTSTDGYPAVITFADTKVTVEENDVANLVCQVDGNPAPAVAWYNKNGEKIDVTVDGRFQMSLDYSLRIMNVVPSDTGFYRCVANNGLGTPAEKDIELEVTDPTSRAIDIIPPQELNPVVTLGSPIILRCWATGWPRALFSWWRGQTMMPRTSEQYETLPLGGLRINVVTLRDLGPYTCQAYNGEGRPATNTFIIRALGPVPAVSPRDQSFLQYVVNPPRIPTFAPTTTTTGFPVVLPENRPYRPDYVTSPPDPYNVHLKAVIRSNATKFTPFSDIRLPCEVQGYPPPTVTWYHNNVPLQNTDRIYISVDNTLTIKSAEEIDAGIYKCEVRNQFGETSSTTEISVQGVFVHPSCTDNPFFANCKLIVKAQYCTNTYYARFCCRSCTIAGQLPSFGPHLQDKAKRIRRRK